MFKFLAEELPNHDIVIVRFLTFLTLFYYVLMRLANCCNCSNYLLKF
jgi:hypothetical protein